VLHMAVLTPAYGTSHQRADGSFLITATVDCIRSHSGVSSRDPSIKLIHKRTSTSL